MAWFIYPSVIKIISDFWKIGGFLQVLLFPPPIKLTQILLKMALHTNNPRPTKLTLMMQVNSATYVNLNQNNVIFCKYCEHLSTDL